MIRFLKGLVLLPVAILVVAFAVANRDVVRVSFDPVSPDMPVFSAALPLYLLLFIAVAIGVLLGGCGAWLGQAGTRRTSAARRREIRRLESETARLKTYAPAPTNEGPNGIYRNAPDRVALPAPH
ncbi:MULTISPECIES: LapA family protein [unclassified Methylobacterium]|jgi:uncharacterized integral membrane protein|uniref:lipopolysaccharide assembly protein LapA domain-containing protein n=1 Tax=unclassified Methylobacterium TaxID=2615210 RepID=UPI0006FE6CB6|nr:MULTISPECIES: LapA family protein [unclassified Methylobacterium]KQO73607.1 GMP synthase [Methylobacterium sp. Leaf89]KQO76049.1 GMP synthase [Methylobacterium sp. Leaf88]KQT79064.1 GMP synthase [Methylobacterium sp. Leaf465]KQU31062.1 GMP synthase [Methylobacterium sp. Leaf94]